MKKLTRKFRKAIITRFMHFARRKGSAKIEPEPKAYYPVLGGAWGFQVLSMQPSPTWHSGYRRAKSMHSKAFIVRGDTLQRMRAV